MHQSALLSAQAMQSFLTNDKYADIELQGSDCVVVRANRAMLAARSPMLDRMLYGDFAERTRPTVTVSYTTGEILAAIVQYVYRDECDIFQRPLFAASPSPSATTATATTTTTSTATRTARVAAAAGALQLHQQQRQPLNGQGPAGNAHSLTLTASAATTRTASSATSKVAGLADNATIQLEWIRNIVAVFDAAKYFLLPGLCRKASTLAQSIMEDQPATAGVFFAACESFREGASDLEHLALSIIARNPKVALLTPQSPTALLSRRRSTMVIPIHGNDIHGTGGGAAAGEDEEEDNAHTTTMAMNIRYNRHAFRCMSSTQLQKLLMYPYLQTDEATRFLILQTWATALDNTIHPDESATLVAQTNKRHRRHRQVTAAASDNESNNTKNHAENHGVTETKSNDTNEYHDDNTDDDEQEQEEVERAQRRRQAKQLTEHLHLERIDAIQLSSVVSFSGLVSTEQFCHAYQTQALLAAYLKPGALSWKSSGDVVFDCQSPSNHSVELLHCRELRTGIHKWSIKLECTGGNDQYLGVAACSCSSSSSSRPLITNYIQTHGNGGDGNNGGAADDGANNNNHDPYRIDPNQWLGSQVSGWVYGSNGSACHAMGHNNYYYGDRRPVFDQGSIITFVLDLTPCSLSASSSSSTGTLGTPSSPTRRRGVGAIGGSGGIGGTLSASVGGLPTCLLFSNMLAELPPDYGFVPAISLRKPGRVRFLGFDVSS
jgi:BTB/POZ domain